MVAMGERLGCVYGLSDHTPDIYTAIAAVALGASAVEKHFTLSKELYGPDHHASLEPDGLRSLVDGVRQVEAALGTGEKERDPAHDPVRQRRRGGLPGPGRSGPCGRDGGRHRPTMRRPWRASRTRTSTARRNSAGRPAMRATPSSSANDAVAPTAQSAQWRTTTR